MNKSNCEEIEEVRNNILTGEKFDEMIKKYEDNPLLDFFRNNNRRFGYCEISLIGMWMKTLQDVPELVNVGKELTKRKKDYQHARLQLKIAATIHRNDNSNVIKLEPVIELNDLKDQERRRKPDLLADIKGEKVYIEIVTKNETERYVKYYNIDLLVKEIAKSIDRSKNVYTYTQDPQTIPSVQEINNVLRDVASRFQKGIFSFCIPKEHLFRWDKIPENDRERFLSYLSNYHNICWAESAEIRKSDDDKTIYIFKDENSAEVTIDEKEEKALLKISDDKTPHDLKVKKESDELNIYHKNNFVITVKEGCESSSCSIRGAAHRIADVIRNIINDKSAQLPKNSPGFIVTDLTGIRSNGPDSDYIKKEMQRCFENHKYCSDILGMAFISNHADFNTSGCSEERYFMFFENDNHNCGIDSKDVVNALKGRWHADFTCLKRYRDLFDNFYNEVPIPKYVHWQDKLITEAEEILRDA
ncbi:MAG: hypothetical protein GWP10_10960 [Nitrospiraceae bacterium]|nr:hypothetical protein [Nitrospiraceae bacterium]